MSQPEYEAIVDEIRSSRITASPELRDRMLALASAVPPAPPRRELPWRRMSLVLVPACVALGMAGALAAGLATSGKHGRTAVEGAVAREAAPATAFSQDQAARPKAAGGGGAGLPTTPGRAQLYEAELTLRVKDLSAATKRALRLTRSFNGYVRTVDYGAGRERGTATLVLRVPVGSIQAALVEFSALGTIVDQHVSIQDVQPQLDKRFRQMQTLRDTITKLQARLENPSLSVSERKALEDDLVAERRQLAALQQAQTRQQRQASFATVSLELRSAVAVAAKPDEPGRLGRALDRSGSILLDELEVVIYALIVGAPLLAIALLALVAARLWRRRTEARLLSTS
jgi:hypothetical protein